MTFIGAIFFSAFFGAVLYFIADKKGSNKRFWLVMGILFGPFALPFVFLARTKDPKA